MRYPADHREKTRQRILDAAGIVFRRAGFQAGSVDDVMAEAGLTAGAFYAHFKSKDELFAEAFIQTLRQGRTIYGKGDEQTSGTDKIRAIVAKYLSPAHRGLIDQGCPLPPLLADLPRQEESTRRAFQEVLGEIATSLEGHLPGDSSIEKSNQALGILAVMVGGLSLSRAVADASVGHRILTACQDLVDTVLKQQMTLTSEHSSSKPDFPPAPKKGKQKP